MPKSIKANNVLQEGDQSYTKLQSYMHSQAQDPLLFLFFIQVLLIYLIDYVALDLLFQNLENLAVTPLSIGSIQDLDLFRVLLDQLVDDLKFWLEHTQIKICLMFIMEFKYG